MQIPEPRQVECEPRHVVGLHDVVPMADLTSFFTLAFTAAAERLAAQGTPPAAPAVAHYRGPATERADVTAGFPVPDSVAAPRGLVVDTLPGGPAVEVVHRGRYETLGDSYAVLSTWVAEHGAEAATEMWEEYLVGPDSEQPPEAWETRIVQPLLAPGT